MHKKIEKIEIKKTEGGKLYVLCYFIPMSVYLISHLFVPFHAQQSV